MNKSVVMLTVLSAATMAVAQDPVGWWKFDESGGTVAHASAGSVDGSLMGATNFMSGGIANNALSVPGASSADYVSFGNNFGFTSGGFTASAWIKTTEVSTGNTIIMGKHHATVVAGWMLRLNQDVASYGLPGRASFYVSEGNVGNVPISNITVTDGRWHHIVGVYSPGTASLYVDGIFQDARSAGANNACDADFMVAGALVAPNNLNEFQGGVDDAQLYDRALNPDEINYLYRNPGSALPEPATLAVMSLGLAALLRRKRT